MGQAADLVTRALAMRAADVLDVVLVAGLVFALLHSLRGTRAVQLLRGLLILLLLFTLFSRVVQLPTFSNLVRALIQMFIVGIPIVFQPELRRMMERLGRAGRLLPVAGDRSTSTSVVPVIALAARRLSEARHGGLIVIERTIALDEVTERGVKLDAEPSVDLLTQLFYPNTPLHDGAVILRGGRIVAARVVLPLRDAPLRPGFGFGTRHLAAVATTEFSDAVAVVVSEETGRISLADGGRLRQGLDEAGLSRLLYEALVSPAAGGGGLFGPLWRAVGLDDGGARGSSAMASPERGRPAGDRRAGPPGAARETTHGAAEGTDGSAR